MVAHKTPNPNLSLFAQLADFQHFSLDTQNQMENFIIPELSSLFLRGHTDSNECIPKCFF